ATAAGTRSDLFDERAGVDAVGEIASDLHNQRNAAVRNAGKHHYAGSQLLADRIGEACQVVASRAVDGCGNDLHTIDQARIGCDRAGGAVRLLPLAALEVFSQHLHLSQETIEPSG